MYDDVGDTVKWEYNGLIEIIEIAEKLLKYAGDKRIFLFKGEMGAGKTTFIKALCKALNVEDVINSPTFSIINEYITKDNDVVYHFDFYRVKTEYEAQDIGVEEYFYSDSYCFIEWPSKIPHLIPDEHILIEIIVVDKDKRQLLITKNEEA